MTTSATMPCWKCTDWFSRAVTSLFMTFGLLFVFRELLAGCISRWSSEPQYSHGFIIPLIAVGLGWIRRNKIPQGTAACSAAGLALLLAGLICHLCGTWFYAEAVDSAGLLISIAGTVLLVWGRQFFRGVWPAIAFLGFMVPLPFQLERLLADPLQLLGASLSAWLIQSFGIPALAQGNIILMDDVQLGVAEACSGLRMLMVFVAISAATILISNRARWEKILILLSSIPIALISNVLRIVLTAIAHQYASRQMADLIFHDLSGWLMMPLAMLLLFLQLKLVDCLFVDVPEHAPEMTFHRSISGITTRPS